MEQTLCRRKKKIFEYQGGLKAETEILHKIEIKRTLVKVDPEKFFPQFTTVTPSKEDQ